MHSAHTASIATVAALALLSAASTPVALAAATPVPSWPPLLVPRAGTVEAPIAMAPTVGASFPNDAPPVLAETFDPAQASSDSPLAASYYNIDVAQFAWPGLSVEDFLAAIHNNDGHNTAAAFPNNAGGADVPKARAHTSSGPSRRWVGCPAQKVCVASICGVSFFGCEAIGFIACPDSLCS